MAMYTAEDCLYVLPGPSALVWKSGGSTAQRIGIGADLVNHISQQEAVGSDCQPAGGSSGGRWAWRSDALDHYTHLGRAALSHELLVLSPERTRAVVCV